MNGPQLDRHGERAARELANRLQHVPPVYLADPYAFALRFIQDLIVENWRYIPPPLDAITSRRSGDPPNEEFRAAKADLLTRKDTEDHA